MVSYPVSWDLRTADGLDAFAVDWYMQVSLCPGDLLHTTAFVMATRNPFTDHEMERPGIVRIDDPTGANTESLGDEVREMCGRLGAIAVAVMVGADDLLVANDVATEDIVPLFKHAPPQQLLVWTEHMLPELNGRAWSAPLNWYGDVSIGPVGLRVRPVLPPDGPLANLLPQRTELDS